MELRTVCCAGLGPILCPVGEGAADHLLLALLSLDPVGIDTKLCKLLRNGVKHGGIGIRNPIDTASAIFNVLKRATDHLVNLLVEDTVTFDSWLHNRLVSYTGLGAKMAQAKQEHASLSCYERDNHVVKQRNK